MNAIFPPICLPEFPAKKDDTISKIEIDLSLYGHGK